MSGNPFKRLREMFSGDKVLLCELIPDEEKTWREWVDFKERNFRDLLNLVEEARMTFKKRAIFLLLTPGRKYPFYWKGRLEPCADFLSGLSPELAEYALVLVLRFKKMIEEKASLQSFYNICLFLLK